MGHQLLHAGRLGGRQINEPCRHIAHATKAGAFCIFVRWPARMRREKGDKLPKMGSSGCRGPTRHLRNHLSTSVLCATNRDTYTGNDAQKPGVSACDVTDACGVGAYLRALRASGRPHGAGGAGGRPPGCRLAPGQSGGSISTIRTSVLCSLTLNESAKTHIRSGYTR